MGVFCMGSTMGAGMVTLPFPWPWLPWGGGGARATPSTGPAAKGTGGGYVLAVPATACSLSLTHGPGCKGASATIQTSSKAAGGVVTPVQVGCSSKGRFTLGSYQWHTDEDKGGQQPNSVVHRLPQLCKHGVHALAVPLHASRSEEVRGWLSPERGLPAPHKLSTQGQLAASTCRHVALQGGQLGGRQAGHSQHCSRGGAERSCSHLRPAGPLAKAGRRLGASKGALCQRCSSVCGVWAAAVSAAAGGCARAGP